MTEKSPWPPAKYPFLASGRRVPGRASSTIPRSSSVAPLSRERTAPIFGAVSGEPGIRPAGSWWYQA